MIDIHTHILPGVDDGPQTIEESLEILKRAANEGVKAIVATPHVLEFPSKSSWQRVRDAFNSLKQALKSEEIDIEIILGAEIFISPDLPMWIKQNKDITINNGNRYVLLELPIHEIPPFTEHTIFELLLQGIVPIIAHPERYHELQKDTSRLFDMIKRGVLTQLNSSSLQGRYGRKAKKAAKSILTQGLIHMIGSDVHSSFNGPYPLSQGMMLAAEIVGMEAAKAMVTSVPEKIINGEVV